MPKTKDPAKLEANANRIYGCSLAVALALNQGKPLRAKGSAAMAYTYQRQSAADRGISWEITFPEWLGIWEASGRWSQRGIGKGAYCMARHGDTGPYKLGNVSIQVNEQNWRDGIKKTHATKAARLNLLNSHGQQFCLREPRNATQSS